MDRKEIKGIMALVPAVFDEKRDPDIEGFKENIRYLEDVGMHGIICMASVGEFYQLSDKEWETYASAAVDSCRKMTCVVGTHYQNTREAIRRTKYAEDIGADGAMICWYHYFAPDNTEYCEHFRKIHEATSKIQIMAYNYPPECAGLNITPELWDKLVAFERITAVRESIEDVPEGMVQATELVRRYGNRLNVLAGSEAGLLAAMMLGGKGCLATYGLAMPKILLEFYDACISKNWEKALQYHFRILKYPWEKGEVGVMFAGKESELFPGNFVTLTSYTHLIAARKAGFMFPGTVTTHKAVIEAAGRKAGPPRLPFETPTAGMRKFAKGWLKDLGVVG